MKTHLKYALVWTNSRGLSHVNNQTEAVSRFYQAFEETGTNLDYLTTRMSKVEWHRYVDEIRTEAVAEARVRYEAELAFDAESFNMVEGAAYTAIEERDAVLSALARLQAAARPCTRETRMETVVGGQPQQQRDYSWCADHHDQFAFGAMHCYAQQAVLLEALGDSPARSRAAANLADHVQAVLDALRVPYNPFRPEKVNAWMENVDKAMAELNEAIGQSSK